MPEDHAEIEAMVPPEYWEKNASGTHAKNRALGLSGMVINLGPTRSYTNKVTQEVSNQPYKFDPEMPRQLSVIPGFEYNQWDLLSVFVTAGAPFIGAVAGATENKHIDSFKEKLKAETYAIRFGGGGLKPPEEKKKSTLTDDDLKKLYGDRVVVNNYANIKGKHKGNVNINFPGYEGRGSEGSKSKNIFGEALNFKPGSEAEYLLKVTGELGEGSSIVRKHEDK